MFAYGPDGPPARWQNAGRGGGTAKMRRKSPSGRENLRQLIPVRFDGPSVPMSDTVAIIVLRGWLVVTQAVGAWRTRTQDA